MQKIKSHNKSNFINLLLVIGFFNSTVSYSQTNLDFASLNYSLFQKSNFKDRVGDVKLSNFDFNLVTPTIKLSTKAKINNIIYYRFSDYSITAPNSDLQHLPTAINEIKYTLFTKYTFNTKLEMYIIPRLSLRSNFGNEITADDFFPAFSIIAVKTSQKNSNFKFGFGINYNNDLDKNSVIPILAFIYSNENLRLNAFLPNNASIVFLPKKKMEYGLGITSDPIIYHLNSVDTIDYVQTLNVNITPLFSYNLVSNVWLNFKTGLTFNRKIDFFDRNFDSNFLDHENELKTSYFAQIGISLRTKK
jgi:hypothetical protein